MRRALAGGLAWMLVTIGPAVLAQPVPPPMAQVDINTASAGDLVKVPYIGRKRAAAIISGRPWHSPEDLVGKRVLPRKYYDRIKDRLTAGTH